jgi:hypothetical protein
MQLVAVGKVLRMIVDRKHLESLPFPGEPCNLYLTYTINGGEVQRVRLIDAILFSMIFIL